MDNAFILPDNIVDAIIAYKAQKWDEENLNSKYPNKILRKDVLEILDYYCTVVYYPLNDEKNNGFHIFGLPDKKGNDLHFVFINTAQTMEKQVFTAAHELGHVWGVDEFVEERCGVKLKSDEREHIINRFAAELLMPKEEFKQKFYSVYDEYKEDNGRITLSNLLKLIARLMNDFFVPIKSVILRLYEIDVLRVEDAQSLVEDKKIFRVIEEAIRDIVIENGYIELQKGSGKKWIEGLSELLDEAEINETVTQRKIDNMREIFDLPRPSKNKELDRTIDVNIE